MIGVGTMFPKGGKVTNPTKGQIRQYAEKFIKALKAGEVPLPSGGDCWFCLMGNDEGKTWGEVSGDTSHLVEHIEEDYFVPSLLVRAVEKHGPTPRALSAMRDSMKPEEYTGEVVCKIIEDALVDYMFDQLYHHGTKEDE